MDEKKLPIVMGHGISRANSYGDPDVTVNIYFQFRTEQEALAVFDALIEKGYLQALGLSTTYD